MDKNTLKSNLQVTKLLDPDTLVTIAKMLLLAEFTTASCIWDWVNEEELALLTITVMEGIIRVLWMMTSERLQGAQL